ncbi:type II toxin-antitoxin system VapC family toxin [Paenibacillus tarimensis]
MGVKAIASTVSLTEILAKLIHEGNAALEKQYKLFFTDFPNLSVVPIDNIIAERAAYLRGTYNIKTPDALILASAVHAKADFFITNDLRLEQIKEIECIPISYL